MYNYKCSPSVRIKRASPQLSVDDPSRTLLHYLANLTCYLLCYLANICILAMSMEFPGLLPGGEGGGSNPRNSYACNAIEISKESSYCASNGKAALYAPT
jgi:hypothetical protein